MPPNTRSAPSASAHWSGASTPFWSGTTMARGASIRPTVAATSGTCQVFTATSSASTGARASMGPASTRASNSPRELSMRKPRARTASRAAPRATRATSCPARARSPATIPPTPPGPTTPIRMGKRYSIGRDREVFEVERGGGAPGRHDLHPEVDLTQRRVGREQATVQSPVEDFQQVQGARGERARRHEGDVRAVRRLPHVVRPAAEWHGRHLASLRDAPVIVVVDPDHDLVVARRGNPVQPDVVGILVDADVRARLVEGARD